MAKSKASTKKGLEEVEMASSDCEHQEESGSGAKKGGKPGPNERANLSLKISRVDKRIRALKHTKRLNKGAAVFATAIIESLVSHILSDGESQCASEKPAKTRITTFHVAKAIRTHPELHRAFAKYMLTNDKVLQKPGTRCFVSSAQ